MKATRCMLCESMATLETTDPLEQRIKYYCPNCGAFIVTDEFKNYRFSGFDEKKHLLSGYVREVAERNKSICYLTTDNYLDMLQSPLIPTTIMGKVNKLLLYFYGRTTFYGEKIGCTIRTSYSICYSRNPEEAESIVALTCKLGLIDQPMGSYTLTFEGMKEAERLITKAIPSNKCFVAMWFNSEMDTAYSNGIKQAIEDEQCGGLKAFRIDNHEFNDDITDVIIAEIKECRFVVADFTGYRGGVYYEAGYAKGLGKPVIFTCRKDWFNGEKNRQGNYKKEKVHFDINHMNFIVWETPEQLKQKLINRIRSTIL